MKHKNVSRIHAAAYFVLIVTIGGVLFATSAAASGLWNLPTKGAISEPIFGGKSTHTSRFRIDNVLVTSSNGTLSFLDPTAGIMNGTTGNFAQMGLQEDTNTITATVPEFSGTLNQLPAIFAVGTFSYAIPAGHRIESAKVEGRFGNSLSPRSGQNQVRVAGVLVGECLVGGLCTTAGANFEHQFTQNELTLLNSGVLPVQSFQNTWTGPENRVRLSVMTLTITTKSSTSSINGRILMTTGDGVAGVQVTVSGTSSAMAVTSDTGGFTFPNLHYGGDYLVTPTLTGCDIQPLSISFTNLVSDQVADFTADCPDLRVEKIEPVQVIYSHEPNLKLVADKPTAVRVTVKIDKLESLPAALSEIPIRLAMDNQVLQGSISRAAFSEGTASKIFNKPFVPNAFASNNFTAFVDPDNVILESDEENNGKIKTASTLITRTPRLGYVSVECDISPCYSGPATLEATVSASQKFISATYPIPPLSTQGSIHRELPFGDRDTSRPSPGDAYTKGMIVDLARLSKIANKYNFDKIFGVASQSYFSHHQLSSGTVGFTYANDSGAVVMDSADDPAKDGSTAAHELGHMYGIIQEEYDTDPPHGAPAASGFWVTQNKPVNDGETDIGRFCFMGYAPNEKSWVDIDHYDYLFNRLRISQGTASSGTSNAKKSELESNYSLNYPQPESGINEFLILAAVVGKDRKIEHLEWVTSSLGNPTVDVPEGNYKVKVLDAGNQTISEVSVGVDFVIHIEPSGTFPTDIAPFVVKVPNPSNAASIQILKDDQPIGKIQIAGKLLRDAINSVPETGFYSADSRTYLLTKVDLIEREIVLGRLREAWELAVDELRPDVRRLVRDGYSVETALQLTKPEVLSVIDGEIARLQAQTAPVSVSGRVTTNSGTGIANAQITLTDAQGNVSTASTTSNGFYQFDNVRSGQTLTARVFARRYRFNPSSRVIAVNGEMANVDFVAEN